MFISCHMLVVHVKGRGRVDFCLC